MTETYIPAEDVLARIKQYKMNNKEDFNFETGFIKLSDKTRDKLKQPIKRNQDRDRSKKPTA